MDTSKRGIKRIFTILLVFRLNLKVSFTFIISTNIFTSDQSQIQSQSRVNKLLWDWHLNQFLNRTTGDLHHTATPLKPKVLESIHCIRGSLPFIISILNFFRPTFSCKNVGLCFSLALVWTNLVPVWLPMGQGSSTNPKISEHYSLTKNRLDNVHTWKHILRKMLLGTSLARDLRTFNLDISLW